MGEALIPFTITSVHMIGRAGKRRSSWRPAPPREQAWYSRVVVPTRASYVSVGSQSWEWEKGD
jgi:hypothetical protein